MTDEKVNPVTWEDEAKWWREEATKWKQEVYKRGQETDRLRMHLEQERSKNFLLNEMLRRSDREVDAEEPCAAPSVADILDEVYGIVTGDRQTEYGGAERSFDLIARFWNTYLHGIGYVGALEPHNVAIMMALLKTARLCRSPRHRDSWVDGAGYFALGGECALKEESK